MKPLRWNLGKNLKLKLERGIGFETIAAAIELCALQGASGSIYLYTVFEMD